MERTEHSHTDELIRDLDREGRPHAEIAARLGISIGDVKGRLERMQRPPSGVASARDEQGGQDDTLLDGGATEGAGESHRLSRRALLGGAIGLGALGGAGAVLLSRGGSDSTPSDSGIGAVLTPTATATPVPTPTPHPGIIAIEDGTDDWERIALADGEAIPWESGVGFVNTANGAMDLLRFAPANPDPFGHGYWFSSGKQLLGTFSSRLGPIGLFDRSSGRGYRWDGSVLGLALADPRMLVFADVAGPELHPTGHFTMTTTGLDLVGGFDLPPDLLLPAINPHGPVALSPGATFLVVSSRESIIFVVDVATGKTVRHPLTFDGIPYFLSSMKPAPDGADTFVAEFAQQQYDPERPVIYLTAMVGPEGVTVTGREEVGTSSWGVQRAVHGRYAAVQGSLRSYRFGLGDQEDWVYTELRERATGQPLFRVLSGLLGYGWGGHRRWLADGSAFIVEAQDPSATVESYDSWRISRRHYLVSPDGELNVLPQLPALLREETFLGYWGGPEPAPDDPNLLAYGRVVAANRATGEFFAPANPTFPMPADPWGNSSDELAYTWPVPGKDASSPGTVLSPLIEFPPFRDSVSLVVARTDDCLNLRDAPRRDAGVLACLPDGTPLTVVAPRQHPIEGGVVGPDGPPAFWSSDTDDPYQMYVHVATSDGQAGWVAIQYLDWAPA